MTFRPATDADRPMVERFLTERAEFAMFPLSNLLRHGADGGHPRAMRFWLAGEPVAGVLGLTGEGMALPVLPAALAPAAADAIRGRPLMGLAGEAAGALALRAALGLDGAPMRLDHVEPHMALDLADLVVPDAAGLTLRPLGQAPRALMRDWCVAYDVEALGAAPEAAREEAEADLDAWTADDSHRVLWRGDAPVARTGFNARVPGAVQVGGVYVPPPLRGRGHARAAVALHLAEARAAGATRATLFAASDAARRAYEAVGFRLIGHYLLCLLGGPRDA